VTPHGLRVEHLDDPLGIHTAAPRFSWRLPGNTRRRQAYRTGTDNGWDWNGIDALPDGTMRTLGPGRHTC
jgi:alpha-L-rhamnosidase